MALNFGILDQGGPTNFFEGYRQADKEMQANAMAQQRAAQAQQEFGMRQQEFAAGQADKQRVAKAAAVTQKTASARDAILRAPTAADARRIVQMQYDDPDLGPIRSRFGSLAQALAEVPDEPTAFQQYKEQEAMGMEAFLKQQGSNRAFTTAMGGAPQTNAMGAAPTNAMVAPVMSGELQNFISQRSRLAMLAEQSPQVKATIDRLDKDIARLVEEQKPEPGFTLSAGQTRYPRGYTGTSVISAPAAAAAAVKPPDKIEIMTLLGYPLTPEGDAAYEAAKRAAPTVSAPTGTLAEMKATGIPETPEGLALYYRLKEKPPVVAPQALTTEERNARAIALGAGPEGSPEFNAALREEISRMTAKPPAAVKAEPTTNEMTNARAIALKAGPEGSDAFNAVFFPEMSRMTAKPITAPESTTSDIKNATALALLKGERGTAAFNKEFVKQMEKSTAKSGGGEGGGGAGGAAGTGTVEVVDPKDRTKTIIVTKARAVAEGLTPAKAMEGLPIKEKQRRESVYPKVKQAMTTVTNTMSTIEETIDRLLANTSGLNGVTGLIYGITPALTDAARQADADLGQLANLAFVQGLTELRSASSTGAGVGNVSNKEGDRFENLKSSLKRTQSFGDMKASLIRLKAQAQATKNIVNTEFEDMYEYRQGQAPAAPGKPAPAAAGVAPPPGFKRD